MRRAFVIFLILLFPLNVLALSLSVAATQAGAAGVAVQLDAPSSASTSSSAGDSLFAKVFDIDTSADLDPDEPPAMDLHDIVNHEAGLRLHLLPGRAALCHDARRHCHFLPPPVKPPRAA
ncbi:hypothetical protein [Massilia brevitalea]|uniref:hypothetical protein n=1 Tax=Massilia brevitalea TaxID=442526 RepID=UPI00273A0C72|nr:hypothetical protein [Massilia brevitalea]